MGEYIRNFTDSNAWQEAHRLTLEMYKITKQFPDNEQFGLTNQMRRASVSAESNIAEGFGRNTAKNKSQFYAVAKGSLLEVQSQLLIARDLKYIDGKYFEKINNDIITAIKLVSGLVKSAVNR
jgi:four helix bundle protein